VRATIDPLDTQPAVEIRSVDERGVGCSPPIMFQGRRQCRYCRGRPRPGGDGIISYENCWRWDFFFSFVREKRCAKVSCDDDHPWPPACRDSFQKSPFFQWHFSVGTRSGRLGESACGLWSGGAARDAPQIENLLGQSGCSQPRSSTPPDFHSRQCRVFLQQA